MMSRWGDAPVHSIAVAMLLKTTEVHFFNDIGYKHNPLMHCPTDPFIQKNCWCDEKQNFGMYIYEMAVSLCKANYCMHCRLARLELRYSIQEDPRRFHLE